MQQEAFDEGAHLVLSERKAGVTQMKRGAFQQSHDRSRHRLQGCYEAN
jgi:hypothetical protein